MPFIRHEPSSNLPRRLQRVLDLLRQRPHTSRELAEALLISARVARQYVYELANDYPYTIKSNGAYRNPTYTLRENQAPPPKTPTQGERR